MFTFIYRCIFIFNIVFGIWRVFSNCLFKKGKRVFKDRVLENIFFCWMSLGRGVIEGDRIGVTIGL